MLKKLRLICGYSHEDVAKTLGISRPTYTYYELGKTVPDVVTLIALGRIYGIQPEFFLHPEEFTDLETAYQRPPKKVAAEPKCIGELSPQERFMIAEYRLKHNLPK